MRNHELLAFICETIKVREHMGDMACLTLIQSVLEAQRPELIASLKPAEEEGAQLPPPPATIIRSTAPSPWVTVKLPDERKV